VKYLLTCFAWFLFFFISGLLLEAVMSWEKAAFFSNQTTLHLLSTSTPIFILIFFGVFLSGHHLIKQYRTEGKWQINLQKFNILCLFPVVIVMIIETFVDLLHFRMISTFVFILFGYYLSQSLYKG
jgi:hypothetical protein